MDGVIQFRDALQAAYGPLDWLPEPDGTIHHFHVAGDKQGSLNGWYLLFLDGIASGCFGSWKAGTSHAWSSRKPADRLETQLISQRRRLLTALVLRPITTIQARNELNILMPAARIIELREAGHDIYTERVTLRDHEGREHQRCARYHLISLAAQLEVVA
jgi:hypothetical protein